MPTMFSVSLNSNSKKCFVGGRRRLSKCSSPMHCIQLQLHDIVYERNAYYGHSAQHIGVPIRTNGTRDIWSRCMYSTLCPENLFSREHLPDARRRLDERKHFQMARAVQIRDLRLVVGNEVHLNVLFFFLDQFQWHGMNALNCLFRAELFCFIYSFFFFSLLLFLLLLLLCFPIYNNLAGPLLLLLVIELFYVFIIVWAECGRLWKRTIRRGFYRVEFVFGLVLR